MIAPAADHGAHQFGETAKELREKKLRDARSGARAALRVAADWLQSAGAPPAEVEALRAAWRALAPPS